MSFGLDDAVAAGLHIIDKSIPDPAEKQKAEESLRSYLAAADKAQTDVNTAEASNPNIFVAGWRPLIGYVCAIALAYQYVMCPIGTWVAMMFHVILPTPPKLDDSLWQLMFGMLGMGGLRTYEKIKGVTK